MATIAELSQLHPCRSVDREKDLQALYQGDDAFEQRLTRFLPQREREEPARYSLRKAEWHYRNYLGAIIDYFSAMLFTSKPSAIAKRKDSGDAQLDPGEYFSAFREDCDHLGGDVDEFFKGLITDAMVYQRAWFSIEQPQDGGRQALDKADFEKRKLGDCWLRRHDADAVLDWETDDDGALQWVLTHRKEQRRTALGGGRSTVTETWEHYQADRIDTYAITYQADKKPDAQTTQVPLVSTRKHNFGRVPMLCMHLPLGLWAANRLRTPQLAHFRAINAQSWSLTATCYAMPVAKVEDPQEFVKTRQGAGYGIVIGTEESWAWEAPPTAHFNALDTEIKAHKDEIFRIAHQMALGVENNAAAIGRTAESKSADAQSTRVILTAYGRKVKEIIELTYDLISASRGDELTWSVGGLDDFAGIDTAGLIALCTALEEAGGVPSKSFNADLKVKVANAVLADADEARKQLYREEIEENTPDPADQSMNELTALHGLLNGDGPTAKPKPQPGGDRPGGGKKPPPPPNGGGGRPPAFAKKA